MKKKKNIFLSMQTLCRHKKKLRKYPDQELECLRFFSLYFFFFSVISFFIFIFYLSRITYEENKDKIMIPWSQYIVVGRNDKSQVYKICKFHMKKSQNLLNQNTANNIQMISSISSWTSSWTLFYPPCSFFFINFYFFLCWNIFIYFFIYHVSHLKLVDGFVRYTDPNKPENREGKIKYSQLDESWKKIIN